MRRLLGILSVLGAIVWGGMLGWTVNSLETKTRVQVRTAPFCVMIGAALLMPSTPRKEGQPPEEETF